MVHVNNLMTPGSDNPMLRHEWRAVVGPQVDQQARDTLEDLFRSTRGGGGSSSVVKSASVEEFTFGVVPPDLRLYISRFNPTEDYLQFEFDMNWQTVSSHILVRATVQPAPFLPTITIPVHVTDFSIAGRLLVGFRLVQRTPGVSGVDVSFEEKPQVNVSIRPLGLPINDLPGIHEFVMRKIGNMFAAKYVVGLYKLNAVDP
jgi:Ca2+-dependent lipid-binding protein